MTTHEHKIAAVQKSMERAGLTKVCNRAASATPQPGNNIDLSNDDVTTWNVDASLEAGERRKQAFFGGLQGQVAPGSSL